MEKKVVDVELIEKIGEYGIVKTKEKIIWNNGKVFGMSISYDICLEHGDGDIVASFNKIKEAHKWIKEN